jgi:hypothetical protein
MSIRCLHEIPFTYLMDIQEEGLDFLFMMSIIQDIGV